MKATATLPDLEDVGDFDEQLAAARNKTTNFKADSALLRELGERLVGKPYIALAELIKNAYDADASRCIITLTETRIEVSDDGHGMAEKEFLDYWMTVGTRHKQQSDRSRRLGRRVTGSKGVGRLSAQFLAHRMQLISTAEGSDRRLHAFVDWETAIDTGSLTKAEAKYRIEASDPEIYPGKSPHGTAVILHDLKQVWTEEEITELGRQIWMLNSPIYLFGSNRRRRNDADDFRIVFKTDLPGVDEAFETQLTQALANYQAIIRGRIDRENNRNVSLVTVEFDDETYSEKFECPSYLREADWEIRIYNLSGRQPGGVSVVDMREYFERYGGVTVFDKGFRLPYYGAENDWLELEYDHSHRRNRSKLLPDHLHVARALNDLPTQGRIFGVVNVNTARENRLAEDRRKSSGEFLKIQVSRDRLVANKAFTALKDTVRQSIDYYATLKRRRVAEQVEVVRPSERPESKLRRLRRLVDDALTTYPNDETIASIEAELDDVDASLERVRESDEASRVLLGPLASAGMAALAIEHETRKEMKGVRTKLRKLKRIAKRSELPELNDTAAELSDWVDRLEATRNIFLPMMDVEDREKVEALDCEGVVRTVVANLRPLLGNIEISFDMHEGLYFPPAAYSEWSAILQNVILNSANATLDRDDPKIEISSTIHNRYGLLYVSDNGVGIGDDADEYFKPFARKSKISPERRELGMGGTGLGLTIVEMIAENRNCDVAFVDSGDPAWSTTFELSWRVER
ncbi:ATP-binding protein [Pseudooceanicola atlanticus]|uniref:ATP-binding protein n=1 Tax=Pseudooceanicola atlanticus TaxID=1461694 RepID=UPI002354238A|nr:ATP-binding protein [Pseudooceanicola atlanticus]